MIKLSMITVACSISLTAALVVAPALGETAPRVSPSVAAGAPAAPKASDVFRDYEKETGKPIVVMPTEKDKPKEPVKIGEGGQGGERPAPLVQPQIDWLEARIAELENRLNAANAQINASNAEVAKVKSQLTADMTMLKGQFASHTHNYASGVTYTNVPIHGHPAWDVDVKWTSYISGGMGYSDKWTTSKPLY